MKLAFIFIAMVLSFTIEPQSFHVEEIQPYSYVQNSSYETLEIVSNTLRSGQVFASQEEENNNSFINSPDAVLTVFKNNTNIKNNSVINGSFIHKLSTNLKETPNIRSP